MMVLAPDEGCFQGKGKLIGDRIRKIADHWLITLPSMGQEIMDLVDPPSDGLEFTTEELGKKHQNYNRTL